MSIGRRRRRLLSGLLCSFFVFFVVNSSAADWPQFRGPEGTAVSPETGLPTRWSATEGLRWKADLPGRGLSNPVIAGGRVYVTASSGYLESRLHVLCLDSASGRKLWERQFWSTGGTLCHPMTCMAAPTPVTDGERVFALFATGDLAALDRDGNLLWYRSLARDYPTITNSVGMAASPILWEDVLLLPLQNVGESFVAGLDKLTGKNRWKVDRPRDMNWATPLLRTAADGPEVIFQEGGELVALEPATGRRRWSYRGEGLLPAPSPVTGGGLIILPGGVALRPGSAKQEPSVAWTSSRLRTGLNSFLYYKDRIYAANAAAVLNCAEAASGKVLWTLRVKGPFSASPVAGDGKVYLVNEEGLATVVEAGEKGRILATNPVGETVLATPAIADGALFLRSDRHLYCIAEGGRK
jgi:outer membrane protein assembly factor BamB